MNNVKNPINQETHGAAVTRYTSPFMKAADGVTPRGENLNQNPKDNENIETV